MKTLWKGERTGSESNELRRKLEARTGVRWTGYSTSAGSRFVPIWTVDTATDNELALALLPFLPVGRVEWEAKGGSLLELSVISKLGLAKTLIAAKTLSGRPGIAVETGRTGHAVKLWIRR